MTAALGRIWAIALNTFREAIRNKVLYGILVVVVGWNFFAVVLGEMSLNEEARVARDIGLAGVSLFGAITAIYLGVSMLYAEIQKKTIHTILAKPIARHEFVLGKYLGMILTLSILTALFGLALRGLLAMQEVEWPPAMTRALALAYFEVAVVAAIAVFFSSFSTPFLSGIFTFALFFMGRVSSEIHYAATRAKAEWIKVVASAALRLVPDLSLFAVSGSQVDGKHVSVHTSFVDWSYVGTAGGHALGWVTFLLLASMVIFRRRDFV